MVKKFSSWDPSDVELFDSVTFAKPRKGDIGNALFIVHAGMLKVHTGRSLETTATKPLL